MQRCGNSELGAQVRSCMEKCLTNAKFMSQVALWQLATSLTSSVRGRCTAGGSTPLVACGCNRVEEKLQPGGAHRETEASAVPEEKRSNGKERPELAELTPFSVFQQLLVCTRHSTNLMPKWLPIINICMTGLYHL